ncbi:sugar transferase (PEP-CTERM/EpsH1 system associated) [Azoarcus indigens]|uniref:Sugar transferase (PEP-CTERM/EpsH1 system associated) n=1 Tax=Azoarcus indigens TaxID=29545 RepID=A0A4R6E9V6_9RHOO|nr:sugar transferase (PEP-CTERM/EpsH1 system associated) [Azoarcus indigens]
MRLQDSRPLVVHVVYGFRVGGLENGVVNLLNHMDHGRFRHTVVALSECDPAFCARVTRADVTFISLHKPAGHGFQIYPQLFRLFRQLRPAVVHTRNLAALETVVPAWAAGVPVRIHGEHGWDARDPDGTRRKFQFLRRIYRPFVTHYIALSGHISSYLQGRIGVPAARASRICNGVDTQRFRPRGNDGEVAAGFPYAAGRDFVFGTVGRLQEVKDQLNLVRAFGLLAARFPLRQDLRLAIVGDGPLRGAVEAEIARLGVGGQVWLAGERSDVADLMRQLDVFVLPSRAEGISNTILEAMACALPVVATDVGGSGELVVAGETGALVPPSDPRALADAMAAYVTQPALAQSQGLASRRRVEEGFSLEGMVGRYADLYARLLDDAGHPLPVLQQ